MPVRYAGKAIIANISGTGILVNSNPIVSLYLKVRPQSGAAFEVSGQCQVPKMSVPEIGDEINIKFNPSDPNEFVII